MTWIDPAAESMTKHEWDALMDYVTGRAFMAPFTVEFLTKRALWTVLPHLEDS